MPMPGLIRNYTAEAACPARTIARFGANDQGVLPAAAATDALIGVFELGCTAAGDRVDVIKCDIALVRYGGTVTRGAPLTSDANGAAIVAAPAAGANVRIIGFAEISGVSGDIGQVFISPGLMQG